jgi:subtilisin family serine protease
MSLENIIEKALREAFDERKVVNVNIQIKKEYAESFEAIVDSVDKLLKGSLLGRWMRKYKLIDVLKLPSLDRYYMTVKVRADVLALLKDLPFIENVTENVQVHLTPDPPQGTGVTVTMDETSKFIAADKAREIGFTGKGIVGAVLDTGSNPIHPLLKGKYKAEIQCAYYRWDTFENTPKARHFHGPGMQSIFVTVAPDAQIVSCKVFPKSGSTTLNIIYRGIDRAVEYKSDILLASWGSDRCSQELHSVINNAFEKLPKMVFSVSMGNSGWDYENQKPPYKDPFPEKPPQLTKYGKPIYPSIGCPADMTPTVLPTGAIGIKHPKIKDATPVAAFSSRGPPPQFVVSPGGWQFLQTWDLGRFRYPRFIVREDMEKIMVADLLKGYVGCRGTSPAQPHTAGAVAIGKQAFPEISRNDLMRKILESATPLGINRPNNDSGFGIVNNPKMLRL